MMLIWAEDPFFNILLKWAQGLFFNMVHNSWRSGAAMRRSD